jgi:hypothetical protein
MDGGGVNLDEQQISHQYIASIEPTGCREYRSSPARYHLQDHKHNGWIPPAFSFCLGCQLSSHPLPSRKQDSDGGHGTSMVLPRSPHGGFVGHFMGG